MIADLCRLIDIFLQPAYEVDGPKEPPPRVAGESTRLIPSPTKVLSHRGSFTQSYAAATA